MFIKSSLAATASGSQRFGRCLLIGVFVAAGIPLTTVSGERGDVIEYRVKAAFLFNFARFTEWPAENSGPGHDPVRFCVFGNDPFGDILDSSLRDKTIKGRQVEIRRVADSKGLTGCQIVFVGFADQKKVSQLMEAISGKPMLTVSDLPGFTTQGGMIGFYLQENRIRFEVSPERAAQAKLRISSELLRLARVVGGK